MRLPTRTLTAIVAFAMLACDEHVPDGPGPGDHIPPSMIEAVAWDVNHVVVIFDEELTRWTADNPEHYAIDTPVGANALLRTGEALAVVNVFAASMHEDNRTVTLTTSDLFDESYVLSVEGVSDSDGNEILKTIERPFIGTNISDTTPPELVYRVPDSDAKGISTRAVVTVGFSEAVEPGTVARGLRVHGEGARLVSIRYEDELRFACDIDSLRPEHSYTVSLTGVKDLVGNMMPEVQWTFDTQLSLDTTPPSVVSSYPANRAVFVDLGADLTLVFSEPMDPYSVILRPSVKRETMQWSNGNRTVRYATSWSPGRQYTIQIRPGEARDQAGNGSTRLFTLTFSTSATLETGAFAGTIAGDFVSPWASNPAGGLAFAGKTSPGDIFTSVVAVVGADGTYEISRLPNGTYFPFFVMDSDGNRIYQPRYGDALGVFGITDFFPAGEPLTVTVEDTRLSHIDFGVYDPTAVYGLVAYDGTLLAADEMLAVPMRVALFDTEGFDPFTSVPVVAITAARDGVWDYVINTLDTGPIPSGDYYVVAYFDADANGALNPSFEPMGVYGGETPIAIQLSHGKDVANISFTVHDAATGTAAAATPWPISPRSPVLQRVEDFLDAWGDR